VAHKKRHGPAPIPPANRTQGGPQGPDNELLPDEAAEQGKDEGAAFNEQDPRRRLGNYGGAGEHPYQHPGGLNDANH
jgi:hypothetical protein